MFFKFNARVEAATDKPKYLEYVTIRRFYMTCTNCISTITFLTDPEAVVSIPFSSHRWYLTNCYVLFIGLCYGIRCNKIIRNSSTLCNSRSKRERRWGWSCKEKSYGCTRKTNKGTWIDYKRYPSKYWLIWVSYRQKLNSYEYSSIGFSTRNVTLGEFGRIDRRSET